MKNLEMKNKMRGNSKGSRIKDYIEQSALEDSQKSVQLNCTDRK